MTPSAIIVRLLLLAIAPLVSLGATPVHVPYTTVHKGLHGSGLESPKAIPAHAALARRARRTPATSSLGLFARSSDRHHLPILKERSIPNAAELPQTTNNDRQRGRAPPSSTFAISI